MKDKAHIAAFDLDGTVLDGTSSSILTRCLLARHDLKLTAGLRMGACGLRRRMNIAQCESTPEELLFSAFAGQPVEEADERIMRVYNERIAKRVRPSARAEVASVREQGMVPVLASSSFKPIADAVVKELGFDGQVSTVMEERDGCYTARVVGEPVRGTEKLHRLWDYCNERFGLDNWTLERAYSGSYSDIPLLNSAKHAVVVNPDRALKKVTRVFGWDLVDWSPASNRKRRKKESEGF